MGKSDEKDQEQRVEAGGAYAAWLWERPACSEADFGKLCAEHPKLAVELRELDSLVRLALRTASSPAVRQNLRERFGDEARVTLTLDDAGTLADD